MTPQWQAVGPNRHELYVSNSLVLAVFKHLGTWHSSVAGMSMVRTPTERATAGEAKAALVTAALDECLVVAMRLEAMG